MFNEKDEFDLEECFPSEKDKLFVSGDWRNACLHFTPHVWHLYAKGYKDAGDVLVRHVLEQGHGFDSLVYPIVFNYRQCLELAIKGLIKAAREYRGDENGLPPAIHELSGLWRECSALVGEICGDVGLEHVDRLLNEFEQHDPHSFAFRYPTDKMGNASLPNLSHIDLENVAVVVNKLYDILDGVDSTIDAMRDAQQEMMAAYRDMY